MRQKPRTARLMAKADVFATVRTEALLVSRRRFNATMRVLDPY